MRINYFLVKNNATPLYLQLYQQIKQAIYQQELAYGDKLPSKRRLSEFLKISQNTIETAYGQLLAEGYIESKARSGFYVCFQPELKTVAIKNYQIENQAIAEPNIYYDFNPNKIDQINFPFELWKKCGKANFNVVKNELLSLGNAQGEFALRYQIALYLAQSRGVNCQPEQIIIAAGLENCLQQLILLFNQLYPNKNMIYAMEKYGYEKINSLFKLYGKNVLDIPINPITNKLELDFFKQNNINVAYLTPSNLYPFGQVLSINQRYKILEWVNSKAENYIIEDDYDSEFRYKGKPIQSLQHLDLNQKVIYLGSFSKLLMPSLRISFMVLPKSLMNAYHQYCGFLSSTVSRFEQHRLARFMELGYFEKHLNKMRKIYRRKMEYLCSLLLPYKKYINYYGEHSGFYLLIELIHHQLNAEDIDKLINGYSIKIYPIELKNNLFVMGFANLTEQQIKQGVMKLLAYLNIVQ